MNEKQQALINFIAKKYNKKPDEINRDSTISHDGTNEIITDFAITHEIALKRPNVMRTTCTVGYLLDQLA